MSTARKLLVASILMTLAFGCSKSSDGSMPGPDGVDPGPDGPDGTPPDDGSTDHKPGVTPDEGATEFLSADSQAGASGNNRSAGLSGATVDGDFGNESAPASGDASSGARSVERGDIFRVLDDGRILNLNAYRGLQIIDVRDVSAPKIEGRLDVTGTPIELYVVDDRAVVLLNNWYGYYGNRDDIAVEVEQGGLVAVIDISDRSNPVLIDDAHVPGNISTSRLTTGGGGVALYVAAQDYGEYDRATGNNGERTIVRSFDVSGDAIVLKDDLDLGGYVQDIQATTSVMMVASVDYDNTTGEQTTRVGLIDITAPDGSMVMGDEIAPAGIVQNKFNMDVKGDVLRIVSGSNWSGTQTNHLETYNISDLGNATPLDHCTFGAGQSLFATLFVENKAFFVTYLRQDPFHAFAIDDQGNCEEHAEFIVSGWNDFFRTVSDDRRLIGIGKNDETRTNALAVSLYDITDISNPNPLIARDEIELSWASSEASWDDRAFSVLEGAVSVASGNVTETGLVLLPFEGWNETDQTYEASVQLFTFSDTTLTKRGVMDHGSSVRRSFLANDSTAANLSEEQLSLYSITTPDAPGELGRVDVAPSFNEVLVFGDHVARVRDRGRYYYGAAEHTPTARVEIVPRSGNLDMDEAIASFEVPSGSDLVQVGDLLVSVYSEYVSTQQTSNTYKDTYRTQIAVFDLSDPASPEARGTLETERITPSYNYGYYRGGIGLGDIDCFNCRFGGYYGGGSSNRFVTGEAIVFPTAHSADRSIGRVTNCSTYPTYEGCARSSNGDDVCPDTYYAGGINCRTPQSTGEQWCTGEYYECSNATGECEVVDEVPRVEEYCDTYEERRYWNWYSFEVLDLRNPDAPALAATVESDHNDEGTSLIAEGNDVYLSYQRPVVVDGDPRPFVRRYFRKLDVSNPASPRLGAGINVPGDVIAASGSSIFTRDVVWDSYDAETLVARLEIDGAVARLRAQRLFDERYVTAVTPDGAGHVLVSHDPTWSYGASRSQAPHTLSILNSDNLAVAGAAQVDEWASFRAAKGGKAVFSVSGGLLIFNVEDAANPEAQAFFATDGWWMPELLLDGDEILMASGPYGIYRFNSDTYNLRAR